MASSSSRPRGGGQLGGPPGHGPGRMVVQLAGEHPDRQRQAAAQPGDLADPGVGWAEAGPDGQADQQRGRLAGREGVQADRWASSSAVSRRPAGDQHQAAAVAGQQRPDLLAAAASSRTSSSCLPASRSRHSPVRASRSAGSARPGPRWSAAGWPAHRPGPPAGVPGCARATARRSAPPGTGRPAGARRAPRTRSCRCRPSRRSRGCSPPRPHPPPRPPARPARAADP